MTPAEQRVLDAARAYRDAPSKGRPDAMWALLDAALALPRTWPPPTVTDNPAEVVQGEVRSERRGDTATRTAPYTVHSFDARGVAALKWHLRGKHIWTVGEIAADRLVSRPGVTL